MTIMCEAVDVFLTSTHAVDDARTPDAKPAFTLIHFYHLPGSFGAPSCVCIQEVRSTEYLFMNAVHRCMAEEEEVSPIQDAL